MDNLKVISHLYNLNIDELERYNKKGGYTFKKGKTENSILNNIIESLTPQIERDLNLIREGDVKLINEILENRYTFSPPSFEEVIEEVYSKDNLDRLIFINENIEYENKVTTLEQIINRKHFTFIDESEDFLNEIIYAFCDDVENAFIVYCIENMDKELKELAELNFSI